MILLCHDCCLYYILGCRLRKCPAEGNLCDYFHGEENALQSAERERVSEREEGRGI